jgi:hypothetical protein
VKGPWPHGDPQEVARQILAGAQFRRAAQGPGEKTWLDYVFEALDKAWHWLTDPLRGLTGNSAIAAVVGWIILGVVVVGLMVVIVRFATGIWARRKVSTGGTSTMRLGDEDARMLLARALAAAVAGRHHEAAALLWASALRALDERGRVAYDAARTPGEWRRAVRDPNFDALAGDAVVAMFGDRGADAALVARMREAYDRVVPA